MVLSNKKLKQRLRAELAESLAASVAKSDSNNDASSANPNGDSHLQQPKPKPQPLKVLLDSATQRQRLSKREKRRKTLSLQGPKAVNCDGSEENISEGGGGVKENGIKEAGLDGLGDKKKKEKKRKRETNVDEKDGVLVSEENGVDKSTEKKSDKKKKKNKYKKKNNNKAKVKDEEENEKEKEKEKEDEKMVMETNTNLLNDSQINGNVTTKIYVGGIPFYSTEDDIRSYFEACGTITEIDCMTFPESGKFRGIAIISFKTEAAAKRALALDGADMGGLFLTIQPYKTNRTNKSSNFAPQYVEGYRRIYVGNLSWDITEDKLRNFFSDCKISSVRFGMDKETSEFRGYAHVDFVDNLSLTLALKLDQKHVCGRPVKISCAVPLKKAAGTEFSRPIPTSTEITTSRTVSATTETTASRPVPTTTETTDLNNVVPAVGTGKMKRRTCYDCGEKGHISSECPMKQAAVSTTTETSDSRPVPTTTETTDSRPVLTTTETNDWNNVVPAVGTGKLKRRTCYECGEKGHISSDCPKKQAAVSTTTETSDSRPVPTTTETTDSRPVLTTTETNDWNNVVPAVSTGKMKRRTCYECGEKGHISSDCPKKQATTD
ncbi:hypothetical protein G4B88_025743 [Cannabis sativa]|uniref:Uncharacterized protein n=1 Tax=Cannabis sativa TaxID=3483 RepID=A0A7J6DYW2_CANSA|nr:hypothetical protein G4B88_025743 [Cannabis sativa]